MRRRPKKDDAATLRRIYDIERAIEREGLPAHGGIFLVWLAQQSGGSALLPDVREACLLGRSQASRVAEALEDEGLMLRDAGEDGRFTVVRLTAKGRSVVGRIIQAARPHE